MKSFQSRFGVAVLSLGAIAAGYYGGRPFLEKVEFAQAQADVASERAQLQSVEDLSTVFRHVGKVVEPSVVSIKIDRIVKPGDPDYQPQVRSNPFGFGNGNQGGNQGQSEEEQGMGSGVIMEVDGNNAYILTNNHVAGGTATLDVKLDDNRVIKHAKVVGTDAKSDLAVVEIQAEGLIAAHWGNSEELDKGDWVLAFGAPLGYIGSMTHGIVSAFHRTANGIGDKNSYQDFIQTDAPINPGNSGGPLVNLHGEVVGINTAIATTSGGSEGIGLAIPSTQAKKVFEAIKAHGKVVRGWLGVAIMSVADADPGVIAKLGYKGTTGVLVEQIFEDSPAFGKLKTGDIIIGIDGKQVDTSEQLRNRIADTAPNASIALKVWRDIKEQEVSLTVASQPEDTASLMQGGAPDVGNPEASPSTVWGMKFTTLNGALAQQLGLRQRAAANGGALITDVQDGSAASKKLEPGDIILGVGNTPVHSADDAVAALKAANPQDGVLLQILKKTETGYAGALIILKDDSPPQP